ncbi:MAG: HD domain-containing phosphohydrolase [Thermotaleaceae bacterium]
MENTKSLVNLNADEEYISMLAQASMRYFRFPFGYIDYKMIMEDLLSFTGADYGLINLMDKIKRKLVTVAVSETGEKLNSINNVLGFSLVGNEWDLPGEGIEFSTKNKLIKMRDLKEASFYQLTSIQSKTIHKILQLKEAYMIGLYHNEEIIGSVLLGWKKEMGIHKTESIELYINMIGTVFLRKQAEEALTRQKQMMEALIKYSPDGIAILDKDFTVMDINYKFTEIFGYTLKEAIGVHIDDLIVSQESPGVPLNCKQVDALVFSNQKIEIETIRKQKDGTLIPVMIRGGATVVEGKIVGYHAIYTDIRERKKSEERILYLSYHDKLTGLYNRAYFEEEKVRLQNSNILPISIIIGDLNGLKLTNDVFGHREGDKLLINIANIIRDTCEEEGTVCRWGGDEFAVILPNKDEAEVVRICNAIRRACETTEEEPIQISIALGWATKKTEDVLMCSIIKEAEEKMYRHKLLESKSARSNIISSLRKSLHEKSCETEDHGERMRKMGVFLGRKMGLKDNELDELSLLAVLHDIGKIAISNDILGKAGPLTEKEWIEMKRHPEIGYRIAKASQELFSIADYILSHHEWWNGKGYPQGLKGEEIPRLSRILAVVDAYDVMTNHRAYKKPLSHHAAIEEIEKCAGSQFDPEIVALFIEIMREKLS